MQCNFKHFNECKNFLAVVSKKRIFLQNNFEYTENIYSSVIKGKFNISRQLTFLSINEK